MPTQKQALGQWGEQRAAEFLEGKGYAILGRNLRTPHGEIDLLAERGERLIFVEVKTRTSQRYGHPEEAVTPAKLAHMHDAAQFLIGEQPEQYANRPIQFDVIAVQRAPDQSFAFKHYADVRA